MTRLLTFDGDGKGKCGVTIDIFLLFVFMTLCALLVLLFDNAFSIVGFALGECLVVILVLCFLFMGLQLEEDASGRHGQTKHFGQ
jgi:uncharacterized membrane protein YqjE